MANSLFPIYSLWVHCGAPAALSEFIPMDSRLLLGLPGKPWERDSESAACEAAEALCEASLAGLRERQGLLGPMASGGGKERQRCIPILTQSCYLICCDAKFICRSLVAQERDGSGFISQMERAILETIGFPVFSCEDLNVSPFILHSMVLRPEKEMQGLVAAIERLSISSAPGTQKTADRARRAL